MTHSGRVAGQAFVVAMAFIALVAPPPARAAEAMAKGSITYRSKLGVIAVTPRFAYLVKGPDAIEGRRIIRRVIVSETDLGRRISACTTMSCIDADLRIGITVDLDAGPRLEYWLVLNDQRVQYSGTEQPAALRLTVDTSNRVAGKLAFDNSAAGGPQVDIEFDAPLAREFEPPH